MHEMGTQALVVTSAGNCRAEGTAEALQHARHVSREHLEFPSNPRGGVVLNWTDGSKFELVEKFCYLMVICSCAGGGAE